MGVRREKLYCDPYQEGPCLDESDQSLEVNQSLPESSLPKGHHPKVLEPIPESMFSVCHPIEAKCTDYAFDEEHPHLQSLPEDPLSSDDMMDYYSFEEIPTPFKPYRYQSHRVSDFAPFNHFARRFDPTPNDGEKGKSYFTLPDFIKAQEQLWAEANDVDFPNYALKAALLRGKDTSIYGKNKKPAENISYVHFVNYLKTQECNFSHHEAHHFDLAPYYYSIDPEKTSDFPYNEFAKEIHLDAKEDASLPRYLRDHLRFISFADFSGNEEIDYSTNELWKKYQGGLRGKLIELAQRTNDQELLKALTPKAKNQELEIKTAFEQFKEYLKKHEPSFLKKYSYQDPLISSQSKQEPTHAWSEENLYHPEKIPELPQRINPDNFSVEDYRYYLPSFAKLAEQQGNKKLAKALETYESFINYLREFADSDPLATIEQLYHSDHQLRVDLSEIEIDPTALNHKTNTSGEIKKDFYQLFGLDPGHLPISSFPTDEEITTTLAKTPNIPNSRSMSHQEVEEFAKKYGISLYKFFSKENAEVEDLANSLAYTPPYFEGGYSIEPWYYQYNLNALRHRPIQEILQEVQAIKNTSVIDLMDYIILKPILLEAAVAEMDNRLRQVIEEGDFEDFKAWLNKKFSPDYPVQDLPDKRNRFSDRVALTYQNYGFAYRKVEEEVKFHKEIPATAIFSGSGLTVKKTLELVDLDIIRINIQNKISAYSADQNNAKIIIRSKTTGELRVFILNKPIYVTHLIEFKRIPGMEMQMDFHPFDEFEIIEVHTSDGEIILPLNQETKEGKTPLNLDPRDVTTQKKNLGPAINDSMYADSFLIQFSHLAKNRDDVLDLLRKHRSFYEAVLERNKASLIVIGNGGSYLSRCIETILAGDYEKLLERIQKEDPDTNLDLNDLKLIAQKKIIDIFTAIQSQGKIYQIYYINTVIKKLHEDGMMTHLIQFMEGPYHTDLLILFAELGLREKIKLSDEREIASIPFTSGKKAELLATGVTKTFSDIWKAFINIEELAPGVAVLIGDTYQWGLGGVEENGLPTSNPISQLVKLYLDRRDDFTTAEDQLATNSMRTYENGRLWSEISLEALGGIGGGEFFRRGSRWLAGAWEYIGFRALVTNTMVTHGLALGYGLLRPEYENNNPTFSARSLYVASVEQAYREKTPDTSGRYGYSPKKFALGYINQTFGFDFSGKDPMDLARSARHFMGNKSRTYEEVAYCLEGLVDQETMTTLSSIAKGIDWLSNFGDYDGCEHYAVRGLEIFQLDTSQKALGDFIQQFSEIYHAYKSQGWRREQIGLVLENLYIDRLEYQILVQLLTNQTPLFVTRDPQTLIRLNNHYQMMTALGLLDPDFPGRLNFNRFMDYLDTQYDALQAVHIHGTKSR